MTAEARMELYVASLLELEQHVHQGQFTAFQAASHSGYIHAGSLSPDQREANTTAIAAHQERLDWLERNGYLQASQQRWDKLLNAKPEDCLKLYSSTAKATREAV